MSSALLAFHSVNKSLGKTSLPESRVKQAQILAASLPKPRSQVIPRKVEKAEVISSAPRLIPATPTPPGRVFNEDTLDNLKVRVGQGLPKLIIPGAAVSPEGFLAYSTSTKQLYYSDGQQWNEVTGTATFTNLTVTNHLTVGNLATLNNVTVSGSAMMNSLGVTNGVTAGSLSVTNGGTFGNLTVSGTSSLNSASVTNGLTAGSLTSNTLTATNTLSVTNGATLGNLTVSGTSSLNSLGVTNGLTAGNLTVSGTSSLNSASVTNGLTAGSLTSNTLTATNTLTVTNGATVGSLTVNNGETISGGLTTDTLTITSMRVVTGVTNVLSTDSLLLCNTSGGGVTLNLPAGTKGMSFVISDIGRAYGSSGSSTNNITLVPNGSDIFVINNGSSVTGNYVFGLDGAQSKVTYVPSVVSGLGVGVWRIMPETGVAPYNLTVFVSTGGSDSNNGLAIGTPVLTLQQALNIVSAIGWENTCTVSLGSGTFNTPNLQIPKVVYGKQTYPVTIQGTLTTVYSGTINTITNTYVGAAVPDQTSTISYNVTVGASSGNGVLRGDFLRVTSSVGTANQIGFLINDNTNTGLTTETYVMCAYPAAGDLILSTQPAAAAGDTFTVFTRSTTINFNDSQVARVAGNGGVVWFRDINFMVSANVKLTVQFFFGTYLFTDAQFSCNSTTNTYSFERYTRLCTGRGIMLLNPSPNLSSIDVAGVYCVPTVVTSMTVSVLGSGIHNVGECVFRQTQLTSNDSASLTVFNSQFPDGKLFTTSTLVTCFTLLFTTSALFPFSSNCIDLVSSYGVLFAIYCTATSPPANIIGISVEQSSSINLSNTSATGYTSFGLAMSSSAVYTAGSNVFNSNGANGINANTGSVFRALGTALTCNSNTSHGMLIQSGSVAGIGPTTVTCNQNGGSGILIQAGAVVSIFPTTFVCNQNSLTGVTVLNLAQVGIYATNFASSTINQNAGGMFLSTGAVVTLSNLNISSNTANGIGGTGSGQLTIINSVTCSSNTGTNTDGINLTGFMFYNNGTLTCNSNGRHGIVLDNCVAVSGAAITLNANGVSNAAGDGMLCKNGTRLDAFAIIQTTGSNNALYGLEAQGASCYVLTASNTVNGATNAVKVGANAGATWNTINTGNGTNWSDFANASPAYSVVRPRL